MGLCDYGCGQEAPFQLKSGKWCCSPCFNKCPAVRIKNSFGKKQEKKIKCSFCGKLLSSSGKRSHEKSCQLNPYNYKLLIEGGGWHGKVYNDIINKRRKEVPKGYTEKHHIIPKSIGGSNDKSNIVNLTAREHFICHALLVHIYRYDKHKYEKTLNALLVMKHHNKNRRYFNSRLYEYARSELSSLLKNKNKGSGNPNFNRRFIYNAITNTEKIINLEDFEIYKREGYIIGTRKSYYREIKRVEGITNYREKLEKGRKYNMEFLDKAFSYYKENGWERTKKKFNIEYSQQNFVMKCKYYVKDFKPTRGKSRGKKNSKLLVPDMH